MPSHYPVFLPWYKSPLSSPSFSVAALENTQNFSLISSSRFARTSSLFIVFLVRPLRIRLCMCVLRPFLWWVSILSTSLVFFHGRFGFPFAIAIFSAQLFSQGCSSPLPISSSCFEPHQLFSLASGFNLLLSA